MMLNQTFAGPLRHNPVNPRYFTDESGKAIYLTGSHTWAVLQDMWLEGTPRKDTDFTGFLDMLSDNGHNFQRSWSWMHAKNAAWSDVPTLFDPQPFARTGPGVANDGSPKFDLTAWNEAYFARLRERVEQAGHRGIYVSVMLFEGWSIKWPKEHTDSWTHHPMNPANNINGVTDNPVLENGRAWDVFSLNCPQILEWQEAYVRKVLDTLNDLDNVLYEICNEVPWRPEAKAWQDHMAAYTKQYESSKPKQHVVGITAEGGDQDNTDLFATCADWISPSNGRLYEYRYNPPAADGSKVIINDTDHLWGHGGDVAWIWKSLTRGMNVIFMDPWEPIPSDKPGWLNNDGQSMNTRYHHLWDPIRRNMGYSRQIAARMDLNACVPHNEMCTSTYCLADPGREYLCFFPSGGMEGVDLWDAPGKFSVEWLDPATGVVKRGDDIGGANRHLLAAPFPGASVLYLRQTEDGDE